MDAPATGRPRRTRRSRRSGWSWCSAHGGCAYGGSRRSRGSGRGSLGRSIDEGSGRRRRCRPTSGFMDATTRCPRRPGRSRCLGWSRRSWPVDGRRAWRSRWSWRCSARRTIDEGSGRRGRCRPASCFVDAEPGRGARCAGRPRSVDDGSWRSRRSWRCAVGRPIDEGSGRRRRGRPTICFVDAGPGRRRARCAGCAGSINDGPRCSRWSRCRAARRPIDEGPSGRRRRRPRSCFVDEARTRCCRRSWSVHARSRRCGRSRCSGRITNGRRYCRTG